MVTAQRSFEGVVALTDLPRLKASLTDPEGECRFTLEFGRDDLGLAFVEVRADANLPLLCQRTLERYLHPVSVVQRLGLITDEAQESALPEGMEPLLLDEHGQLRGIDLVEDELILALPVVPINPDSTELQAEWPEEFVKEDKPNPFAALAALKDRNK